ncbi:type VI secretion system baseplate subunit TssE [Paraburkholderia edwinii]|jgi:type VI secretion system protein ImpF|uniref:Type VI secretion system baseplate subunit TssE n=1 Tax=Paraburkholderia edwinii TaxID=2861782 RepID=A0ABX8UQS4_9BURK|nr:type VI secretion system baseplate subunit TssE [Paraburkholderia edwinii]QYD71368.1 type VI secretion system baseplate subunit TssE [Paraburkholderia edwinii]
MAELTPQERLQPSLLDRLTDLAPVRREESREQRVITAARLRECVTRDIAWLLNCTRHWSSEELMDCAEVDRSVLNFGIPDLAGTALSGVNAEDLENRIRVALLHFEPRLIASTVQVTVNVDESRMDNRSLSFRIEAEMWAQPMPLALYLRTDLDLETGEFRIVQNAG